MIFDDFWDGFGLEKIVYTTKPACLFIGDDAERHLNLSIDSMQQHYKWLTEIRHGSKFQIPNISINTMYIL